MNDKRVPKVLFKYPSIEQFRRIAYNVNTQETNMKVAFERTVKLHGSNAAIVYTLNDMGGPTEIYAQSRNRILTPHNDNAGFAQWVEDNKKDLHNIFQEHLPDELGNWDSETHAVLYGEWCGEGIQKGVALNQLPKMFVAFDLRIIGSCDLGDPYTRWGSIDRYEDEPLPFSNHDINLYNINEFGTEIVVVDFADPIKAQSDLLEAAEKVGVQCPVGASLGATGAGEGHVYTSLNGNYKFKVKSSAHTVSKTNFMSPEDSEKMKDTEVFVNAVVTDNRLLQGIEYLSEMDLPKHADSSIGDFIKWVVADVQKEEGDLIVSNNLDVKLVNRFIAKIAFNWFKAHALESLPKRAHLSPNPIEEGLL